MAPALRLKTLDNSAKFLDLNLETLKSVSDEEAIHLFADYFPDELTRLQNATPSVETANLKPAGTLTEENISPSCLMYGMDYPEPNRTLISLLALKWLLAGDYETFTSQQPNSSMLTRTSFDELCRLVKRIVDGAEALRAVMVITVLNDIGKDPSLAEEVLYHGGILPSTYNHDDVVYAAAKSDLLPLLKVLSPSMKTNVILGLEMGAKLNISQLAQVENVPGSLRHVLVMKGHEKAFDLKFLEVMLDVAGAAAQNDARGAIVMTEPVYQGLAVCRKALLQVIRGKQSLRSAYDQVLQYRGQILEDKGFSKLNVREPHDRALLRLLAMGRIATTQKACYYRRAFDSLPEGIRESLSTGMNRDGYNDGTAILPYYAPALFAEATRAAKEVSEQSMVEVLASLMRFLARIYVECKPHHDEKDEIIERNLYFAHDTVTSEAFIRDPEVLDRIQIPS